MSFQWCVVTEIKRIKFMADYGCHPLWRADGIDVGNIDPRTIPLSEELIRELGLWIELLDGALDWDYPPDTVWPKNFWADFNERGKALAQRVRDELGPDVDIVEEFWGEDQG